MNGTQTGIMRQGGNGKGAAAKREHEAQSSFHATSPGNLAPLTEAEAAGNGARTGRNRLVMMGVCAPVQRRRRVWKHFVVANVVLCDLVHISRRRVSRDNRMGRIAQVTKQRQDRDVENVISEAPPIRPTAGDGPVIEEASLGRAVKHIATKKYSGDENRRRREQRRGCYRRPGAPGPWKGPL